MLCRPASEPLSASTESQLLDTSEFAEITIESAERQVTGFPSHFQNQTVREAHRRPSTKAGHSSSHGFRILKRQMLVVEEHLDSVGDLLRTTIVDRGQDPRSFGAD